MKRSAHFEIADWPEFEAGYPSHAVTDVVRYN